MDPESSLVTWLAPFSVDDEIEVEVTLDKVVGLADIRRGSSGIKGWFPATVLERKFNGEYTVRHAHVPPFYGEKEEWVPIERLRRRTGASEPNGTDVNVTGLSAMSTTSASTGPTSIRWMKGEVERVYSNQDLVRVKLEAPTGATTAAGTATSSAPPADYSVGFVKAETVKDAVVTMPAPRTYKSGGYDKKEKYTPHNGHEYTEVSAVQYLGGAREGSGGLGRAR